MNPYLTPYNTNNFNEMSNSRFQGNAKPEYAKRMNPRAHSADHGGYMNQYSSPSQTNANMNQSSFIQENLVPSANNYYSNKSFTPERHSPYNSGQFNIGSYNSNQKSQPEPKMINHNNNKNKLLETVHLLDKKNPHAPESSKESPNNNLDDVAGLVLNKDIYKLYSNQNDVLF